MERIQIGVFLFSNVYGDKVQLIVSQKLMLNSYRDARI